MEILRDKQADAYIPTVKQKLKESNIRRNKDDEET